MVGKDNATNGLQVHQKLVDIEENNEEYFEILSDKGIREKENGERQEPITSKLSANVSHYNCEIRKKAIKGESLTSRPDFEVAFLHGKLPEATPGLLRQFLGLLQDVGLKVMHAH